MLHLRSLGDAVLADGRGAGVGAVLRQPKRLALLAFLATRRPTPSATRDELLALFWPDLDEGHARNSLNKTLHYLRRTVGRGVVVSRGRTAVGVDGSLLGCDAVDFRLRLDAGTDTEAMELYRGEFLAGLSVRDAPGFEDWLEEERMWYARTARDAGLRIVEGALSRSRVKSALECVARLDRIAPHDEEVVKASVRTYLRAGDRPAALARLERFETWLREELDVGVPAELVRILSEEAPEPRRRAREIAGLNDPPPELLAVSRQATRLETLDDYKDFVDQSPDMVFRCDLRASFSFVGRLLAETMGWTREELWDTSYDDLIREDYRDRVIEFYVRQVEERVPLSYLEFPAVTRDGREMWVGSRVRLLMRDGIPLGTQASIRNITTRIRRERANRRAALEDRETRLLNRDAFLVMANQRIRESRRAEESFFTIHLRVHGAGLEDADDHDSSEILRVLGGVLGGAVRESDVLARIGHDEIVVLAPRGGKEEADIVCGRVEAAIRAAHDRGELEGVSVTCEAVVHDPEHVRVPDAVLTFAWAESE